MKTEMRAAKAPSLERGSSGGENMEVFEAMKVHEHEQVLFSWEPSIGYKGIIAIHNTMLGPALGGTRFADLGTNAADLCGEARAPAHEGRGRPTDGRAVAVEPDALGHHLHVGLTEASSGAVLALLGAALAGVDTGFEFVVSHDVPPQLSRSADG